MKKKRTKMKSSEPLSVRISPPAAKKVKQAMAAEATAKKAKKEEANADKNGNAMEQHGKNNKRLVHSLRYSNKVI